MGFKELVMESKAEKAKTWAIKPETTGMFKLPVTFLKKKMYRRPGKQQQISAFWVKMPGQTLLFKKKLYIKSEKMKPTIHIRIIEIIEYMPHY